MRANRKQLQAEILAQKQQLNASDHQTRASLHKHLKMLKDRNVDLLRTISDLNTEISKLRASNETLREINNRLEGELRNETEYRQDLQSLVSTE